MVLPTEPDVLDDAELDTGAPSELDPLSHVAEGLGKCAVDLYVGDKVAAGDIDLLRPHYPLRLPSSE